MTQLSLIFDTPCYARTLCHIGAPHPAPQLGATLLQRPIAGQPLTDVVGPWPPKFDTSRTVFGR
jgi:hypothetical protein